MRRLKLLFSSKKGNEPVRDDEEVLIITTSEKTANPNQDAGSSSASCVASQSHNPGESKDEVIEYELYIQLMEAVSEKKIAGKQVYFREKDSKWKMTHTDLDGCIKIGFFEEVVDIEVQLIKVQFPKHEVQDAYHFKTQQEGQLPQKIKLECVLLEIEKVDDHFVPTGKADSENLVINYNVNKLSTANLVLKIFSNSYSATEALYEKVLTETEKSNGQHEIKWDGKTTCSQGILKDKLITPLHSPYKIVIEDSDAGLQSNLAYTKVLFHSIKLKKGSYLEDPEIKPSRLYPDPNAERSPHWGEHISWVQYRLNELGYFAGRVNGVLNPQTKRAIKRYTYEMIGHKETDNAADEFFLNSLAGDDLKVELFEDDSIIENKGSKTKIYIQNNYYFQTEGKTGSDQYSYDAGDKHYERENDYGDPDGGKLDRFECPIEAEIRLTPRTDAAGTGEGIFAPEALTETEIKWTVIDPAEDHSVLPPDLVSVSPSRSKSYVEQVSANVLAMYPGRDNCPPDCGGVKTDDGYFTPLFNFIPVKNARPAISATSAVYLTDAKHKRYGTTAVLFRGSNMGGDNFIVRAEINFENRTNKDALVADHPADSIKKETGEMTVWRKRRITDVIDWRPEKGPPVEWGEVVEAFKAGFVELDVTSLFEHRLMSEVVTKANVRDADMYLDSVIYWMKISGNNVTRDMVQFNPDHMYPFKMEQSVAERFAQNFSTALTRINMGTTSPENHGGIGDFIRKVVRKTKRPGIIVLRCLPFKGIFKKAGLFSQEVNVKPVEGLSCTGVGGGVAYICEGYRKILKDGYLLTHEIAHCYNLTHPPEVNIDHDMGDQNCMMIYLHRNPIKPNKAELFVKRLAPGGDWKPKFCGKCLLKLRGWKVASPGAQAVIFPPASPAAPIQATPCSPSMKLKSVEIHKLAYTSVNEKTEEFQPASFIHVHETKWESNDGNSASLANVKTREHVKYNKDTQSPPFNSWADPDKEFWFSGLGAAHGVSVGPDNPGTLGQLSNTDRHSIYSGSLICSFPLTTGSIQAVQWYEFSIDNGAHWEHIPEAAYILEKEVIRKGSKYFLVFKKYNHPDENTNHFYFEVHYPITGPLPIMPHDSLKSLPNDGGRPGTALNRIWYSSSIKTMTVGEAGFEKEMKANCAFFRLEQ